MRHPLPYAVLGLSALGACASMPEPPPGPALATQADRHRIEVTQASERLEIPVASNDAALSAGSRSNLRAFASGYLRYGHGAVVISAPKGSTNAEAAARVAQQTRLALSDAGVSYAAVSTAEYEAPDLADAPVVVSFSRFEAHAPECAPLYEQDLAHQSNNQPWESFGCATQANLAALVEDPADLLRARTSDPRDSDRRATTMTAYREGEPTHAERSRDERVAISDAVE
ncbi:MAG: CpaD family pilus assembly protein [Hyphomonadaceae bacterium]|nr:CpaD family pilus assembly protein [Hyphomonadaceae bacterium]